MAHENYTQDELNALKGIFSLYDVDKTGSIPGSELEVIMKNAFIKFVNSYILPFTINISSSDILKTVTIGENWI